ncbi:hypothetical protein DFJ73DRAFT_519771 [Zopfochytrium polystomum]|nr:hypothetical protein DFJ73DRAFT_519771 [Zopfochytrium polystomum]
MSLPTRRSLRNSRAAAPAAAAKSTAAAASAPATAAAAGWRLALAPLLLMLVLLLLASTGLPSSAAPAPRLHGSSQPAQDTATNANVGSPQQVLLQAADSLPLVENGDEDDDDGERSDGALPPLAAATVEVETFKDESDSLMEPPVQSLRRRGFASGFKKVLHKIENATPITRGITQAVKSGVHLVKDIKEHKSFKDTMKDFGKDVAKTGKALIPNMKMQEPTNSREPDTSWKGYKRWHHCG